MDALSAFRSAHGSDTAALGLEPLSLHLWLSGRLDLPDLRRARLLSGTVPSRLLLLVLSCGHRAGSPRSTTAGLRRILSHPDPWPSVPDGIDAETLRKELENSRPALLALWDALLETARRDPREIAPWCGLPGGDGVLVEFEDGSDPEWAFRRPAQAERDLLGHLAARIGAPPREVPTGRARAILSEVLAGDRPLDPLQARAVALSLRTPFLVVSGGPGTGKTTVVVRILLALRRLLDLSPDDIALAAPTGRAHARLVEGVASSLPEDSTDSDLVGCGGGTLHSLLGARGDGTFRHDESAPLPHRLVVVDEASMVDIHLFAALVRALGPDSTLVLLGDRDQLPSVEAGAVLSDLCSPSDGDALSAEAARWTESVLSGIAGPESRPTSKGTRPLLDRLVVLERSFRSVPGIVDVSRRVLEGDASWAATLPPASTGTGAPPVGAPAGPVTDHLPAWARAHMDDFRRWDSTGREVGGLRRLVGARRILCAVHAGPSGRESICLGLDRILCGGSLPRHAPGRPLIVPRNRPDLGLRNGDLGVAALLPEGLRVGFPDGASVRWIDPALVPELEPAWALTIHKAQGSEFDEVLVVAPDTDCAVFDRPALYTALTRARRTVRMSGDPGILGRACLRVPDRPSKLRRMLAGEPPPTT